MYNLKNIPNQGDSHMVTDMTRTLKPRLCSLALALLISVSLTSCLPGKEEEKKVISQAKEATQQVQADQVAANMANAAQKLLATANTPTPAATDTPELKTIACNGKVIAYVPKTSRLAKGGTLPMDLSQRMRAELMGGAGTNAVADITSAAVTGCTGLDTNLVALNSPLLVMTNSNAALAQNSQDMTGVVNIAMTPCNGQPGVIVDKTYADGHHTVQNMCGAAAPATLPSIGVTMGQMADYKSRLVNHVANAFENFTCIVRPSNPNCISPTQVDEGTQIICSDQAQTQDMIVNPVYNRNTYKFEPTAGDVACGKGWNGELTARVKTKHCQVVRNGVQEEPAKIFDVAYVGAKCKKNDVVTWGSCPAGSLFEKTGHMSQKENLMQVDNLSLSPVQIASMTQNGYTNRVNVSSISYKAPDGSTNIDHAGQDIIDNPQTLVKATGNETGHFFNALSNLSVVATNDFDQQYVNQLKGLTKMMPQPGSVPTCYAKAQDCYMDPMPAKMEVIVDRSGIMNTGVTSPIANTNTVCRATMANLFNADKIHAACQAAHDWQNLAAQNNLVNNTINIWNGGNNHALALRTPLEQAEWALGQAKSALGSGVRQQLQGYEDTMTSALKLIDYQHNLLYGLAVGQDCSPPVLGNGYLKVQENTYGSCMPNNVTGNLINDLQNGQELKSCQTGCPGECATTLAVDNNNQPLPAADTKIKVADAVVQNQLIPRLPISADVNYSEIVNEDVTAAKRVKGSGSQAVSLVNANHADINQNVLSNVLFSSTRTTGGNQVPMFKAIDDAIDRLRNDVLNANPNAPATIVIFGSRYDTMCDEQFRSGFEAFFNGTFVGGMMVYAANWYTNEMKQLILHTSPTAQMMNNIYDIDTNIYTSNTCKVPYNSKYFARNICQPEPVPTGYVCHYCTNMITNPITKERTCAVGILKKDKLINTQEIYNSGGLDDYEGRNAWCAANEEDQGYWITVPDPSWGCPFCTKQEFIKTGHYSYVGTPDPVFDQDGGRHNGRETPSSLSVDNDSSLVGFLGRHFPNVKVIYTDLQGSVDNSSGGGGLGDLCYAGPGTDRRFANAYFGDGNNKTRIFYGYNASKADMDVQLKQAVDQATGGGIPSDEAGKTICHAKYGNNVNISTDDPPAPFEFHSNLTSFDAQQTNQCDPAQIYDLNTNTATPSGAKLLPIPSYLGHPLNKDDCIKGVKAYLLTPC